MWVFINSGMPINMNSILLTLDMEYEWNSSKKMDVEVLTNKIGCIMTFFWRDFQGIFTVLGVTFPISGQDY